MTPALEHVRLALEAALEAIGEVPLRDLQPPIHGKLAEELCALLSALPIVLDHIIAPDVDPPGPTP